MNMELNEIIVANNDTDQILSCDVLKSMLLPAGYIPSDELEQMPVLSSTKGSWGPISWDIDIKINPRSILDSAFIVKLGLFGIDIVNIQLDINNPKIGIDVTISGVGMKAELGVDFKEKRVYLSGYLNFILYSDSFDLTLVRF